MGDEGQQAQTGGITLNGVRRVVEFEIVGVDVTNVVIQPAGGGKFRQQRLSKPEPYLGPLVICHRGHSKAVRVSGNFIDAVVADGKVSKLQVGIAAHLVHIEKVQQAHLAESQLEAPPRNRRLQVKRVRVLLDAVRGKRDGVVDEGA